MFSLPNLEPGYTLKRLQRSTWTFHNKTKKLNARCGQHPGLEVFSVFFPWLESLDETVFLNSLMSSQAQHMKILKAGLCLNQWKLEDFASFQTSKNQDFACRYKGAIWHFGIHANNTLWSLISSQGSCMNLRLVTLVCTNVSPHLSVSPPVSCKRFGILMFTCVSPQITSTAPSCALLRPSGPYSLAPSCFRSLLHPSLPFSNPWGMSALQVKIYTSSSNHFKQQLHD